MTLNLQQAGTPMVTAGGGKGGYSPLRSMEAHKV
jgi:hypothetical protein